MIIHGNSEYIPLEDNTVHCCITSPPYWGLRAYLDNDHPLKRYELGLEGTPQEYVAKMVAVFREVWRVLRPDGTCWVNLGDSYATSANGRSAADTKAAGNDDRTFRDKPFNTAVGGLKSKDLCGIPWRVAFALQDDGWYLRSDIIWSKPNPMPESVTDRPTKAHEYIFLLAKSERYFYDAESIREPLQSGASDIKKMLEGKERIGGKNKEAIDPLLMASSLTNVGRKRAVGDPESGRNRRSVWSIPTQPYPQAHYATFPTKLVEPMILAGTSQHGVCGECGSPWVRVVERIGIREQGGNNLRNGKAEALLRSGQRNDGLSTSTGLPDTPIVTTTGWRPTCTCNAPVVPAIVLDPFAGSGTTGQVARQLGRRFVGIDLNPTYLAINALPRAEGLTSQSAIDELPLFAGLGGG